jgi:hypothetical protein
MPKKLFTQPCLAWYPHEYDRPNIPSSIWRDKDMGPFQLRSTAVNFNLWDDLKGHEDLMQTIDCLSFRKF